MYTSTKLITTYIATAYYVGTRSSNTNVYKFTQEHADLINVKLKDGFTYPQAQEICSRLNQRTKNNSSIRYSFSVNYEL